MKSKRCVVIGSGLSGFSSAIILAKNGFDVTVVESHSQPGGCLQSFKRRGAEFETGMHVVGSAAPGEILNQLFNFLGCDYLPLSPLDPDAYQTISLPTGTFHLPSGFDNLIAYLCDLFPDQRDGLHKYALTVSDIASASTLEAICRRDTSLTAMLQYQSLTTDAVVDSLISDTTLRHILTADAPLYGGQRGVTPFSLHAFLRDFYCRSSFRIDGGSSRLVDRLAATLKQSGGSVICNAQVTRIHFDNDKATGVETANGQFFPADYVISTIHPAALAPLLDTPLIRRSYRQRLASLPCGVAPFTLHIKFKPGRMHILNSLYFGYDCDPLEANEYTVADWPRGFMLIVSPDPLNSAFASTASAITYMRYDEVAPWADTTTPGRRGDSYTAFKADRSRRMLQAIDSRLAGFSDCIDSIYTSTPLTYRDYTSTACGAMYGILRDAAGGVGSRLSARTRVPNLLLAGQSTNSHGVLGVIVGAIQACSEIIGSDTIYKAIIHEQH